MSPRQRLLMIGVALVLAVNAFVLLGVAWNRHGSPESRLQLTQRELLLTGNAVNRDDSGLSLRLLWRVADANANATVISYAGRSGVSLPWLDEPHLTALGVDVARLKNGDDSRGKYSTRVQRPILVVIEFDGPAWQLALEQARLRAEQQAALLEKSPGVPGIAQQAKHAQDLLATEERSSSRLFAIDAGTDLAALRARYPDRSHYLILGATLGVQSTYRDRVPKLSGYIERLDITTLHVPHAFRALVESGAGRDGRTGGDGQGYTVTVAVGRRLEPWIESVEQP